MLLTTRKILLLVVISFVYAKSPLHASLQKDIATGNIFVVYYSPRCQFSQHFLNMWKKMNVQDMPTVGSPLVRHLINCKEETDLCAEQKVKYYPSIRFHPIGGSERPLVFSGPRTVSRLLSFLGKAVLGSQQQEPEHQPGDDSRGASPPDSPGGVMQLTDANFEHLTARGPVFVKFYTDWCPHCRQLEPLFPQLAPSAKQLGVALASVNCESQADTCTKQEVPHYPLLALYSAGRRIAVHEGENSVTDWTRFLGERLDQMRTAEASVLDGTVPNWYQLVRPTSLTWESFDAAAKSSEFLFVKFFAPWCSHCQRLAPVWERLAQEFGQELAGQLTIGRVDCTQEPNLCSLHSVNAYPTLLLFRRGRPVDNFRGLRDLAALSAFARAAVSLHGGERAEL